MVTRQIPATAEAPQLPASQIPLLFEGIPYLRCVRNEDQEEDSMLRKMQNGE